MSDSKNKEVKIRKAKGRPMLTWVGKRPLSTVKAYPAQHIEGFNAAPPEFENSSEYQNDWPDRPLALRIFSGLACCMKLRIFCYTTSAAFFSKMAATMPKHANRSRKPIN